MANDIDPQKRWSQQTIPPTSPRECVRALLASPLGSHAWTNPLRFGAFTIHDFWDVRREPEYRYTQTLPTEPLQLAQLMLDTGLKASDIDIAVRIEKNDRDQSITAAMQMHRYLRNSYGLSTTYKDALDCLKTVFEAHIQLELGKSNTTSALQSHLRSNDTWTEALQSLTQYDNSLPAQKEYLNTIVQMFSPAKEKAVTTGALPERGRQNFSDKDAPYIYGWDSTGSAIVQSLPQSDNAALVGLLHAKHDMHGLGAMVVTGRMLLSSFLELTATPALTPLPKKKNHYGKESDENAEEFRRANAVEVMYALTGVLPQADMLEQARVALSKNSNLSDAMQALVPKPKEASDIPAWWTWNSKLHALGLIDATKPSAQMQNHLSKLQQHMPTSARNSPSSLHVVADFFGGTFGQFANNNATLANMALAIFLYNVPRASKPSEMFETFKTMDFAWLAQADCARYITPAVLSDSQYGGKNILAAVAMILPHMSDLDKVRIAPIVAYGLGVQSIQGLSPTTLRAMWKEQRPEEFKGVIPKQYSGDTYILFALTRKSADELMNTLSSMEVRHDVPLYLQCVETWTRQAMALPPAIEDIGPTENLFGV